MAPGGIPLANWLGTFSRYLYVADLIAHRKIVELGCGAGLGCEFLANHGAHSVLGVDRDRAAISEARLLRALVNVEYRVGELDALELEDGSIDLLFASGAEALRRPAVALEIRRVLRKDGYLVWSSPSADRPSAVGGVSFHEFGDRLGELFGAHRMVAIQPLVALSLAEYSDADQPAVELDTSLARLGDELDLVSDYVAIFGPERSEARPYTIVQVPTTHGLSLAAGALGLGGGDADRLRDELARERRARHKLESVAHELRARVAELERSGGALAATGPVDLEVRADEPKPQRAQPSSSEAVAAALEAHHAEVRRIDAELAETREYVQELEDEVEESRERRRHLQADLAAERARAQTMRAQLGDWRDRTARAEGHALGLATKLEEMAQAPVALADGTDAGLALERIGAAERLLLEQREVVAELDSGLRELFKLSSRTTQKGRAGEHEHQISALSAQLGGREAEITLLTIGLRSLRDRLAKAAEELQLAADSDSPERWRDAAVAAARQLRAFSAS